MILSGPKILKLNKKYGLIENLCDRERFNPEGAGLDLRVGRVEKPISRGFLYADNTTRARAGSKTELVGDFEFDGNKLITMEPGDFYLVQTMETINAPAKRVRIYGIFPVHLMPDIYPRVSLPKGGLVLLCTKTDPGYKGKLVFGLANVGTQPFEFELGTRMFNVVYHVVLGSIKRAYSGQHQGGRVTSQGKTEIQN